jgi:putative transposase
MEWFRCRTEAKVVIEDWRQHYNAMRPNSSPGNMTPAAFRQKNGITINRDATLKH